MATIGAKGASVSAQTDVRAERNHDHSTSERTLNRVDCILKFLRCYILLTAYFFATLVLAVGFGIYGLNPVLDESVKVFGPRFAGGSILFLIIIFTVLFSLLAAWLAWIYVAIVGVWRNALEILGVLILVLVVGSIYVRRWEAAVFAVERLDPLFAVLMIASLVIDAVFAIYLSLGLFGVARVDDVACFRATLDRRLTNGVLGFLNKLIDLPRRPFHSIGAVAAYILAIVGALTLVLGFIYLFTAGWARPKAEVFFADPSCTPPVQNACVEASRWAAIETLAWMVVAFGAMKLGALLQTISKRVGALTASDVLKRGDDRFLLYLRPFSADDVELPKARLPFLSAAFSFRPFPTRMEEELFDVADGYLPLIAVGKPGDDHTGGRAYRTYLDDDEWRDFVTEKVRASEAIAIVLSDTEGVRWELERLLAEDAVGKTIFFFDPAARDQEIWGRIANMVEAATASRPSGPIHLDSNVRPMAFYMMDGALHQILNENWSAISYRTAFSMFLSERELRRTRQA